jgi:hypothetical protein
MAGGGIAGSGPISRGIGSPESWRGRTAFEADDPSGLGCGSTVEAMAVWEFLAIGTRSVDDGDVEEEDPESRGEEGLLWWLDCADVAISGARSG